LPIKTTISDQLRERESVFGGCHCAWRAENEIREYSIFFGEDNKDWKQACKETRESLSCGAQELEKYSKTKQRNPG